MFRELTNLNISSNIVLTKCNILSILFAIIRVI
jgi:hypothetical protein